MKLDISKPRKLTPEEHIKINQRKKHFLPKALFFNKTYNNKIYDGI